MEVRLHHSAGMEQYGSSYWKAQK